MGVGCPTRRRPQDGLVLGARPDRTPRGLCPSHRVRDRPNPMDPEAPIGEKLRAYRRALGLTQKELAERLGVIQASISDWERGRCRPPAAVRRLLG
jgi:DNA-binding XRE family transcriptional regulator